MDQTNIKEKHRFFLLDIIRIACAFLIYARHSVTMFGCTYGHNLDAAFTMLTSPVMTCFFILSGFSIHYQHRDEAITAEWMRTFMKKRLITIMPSYLLLAIIWPLAFPAQTADWVALLPVDLFGIQTVYRSLFGILHNGGTWFVSCMLLAYILYPIIKAVVTSGKKWIVYLCAFFAQFLLLYSNYIIPRFGMDGLYSNPIARSAEFMIGVAFSEILFANRFSVPEKEERPFINWTGWNAVWMIAGSALISFLIAKITGVGFLDTFIIYLVSPIVMVLLLVSSVLRSPSLEKSKLLAALSGMSYQFFLMQLFLWNLTIWVLQVTGLSGNNVKILGSLILCTVISYIVWRFYDKPIRKLLREIMMK